MNTLTIISSNLIIKHKLKYQQKKRSKIHACFTVLKISVLNSETGGFQ